MTNLTVNRQTFDEVMVPVFSPRRSCRIAAKARACGTRQAVNTWISHAASP